MSDEVLHSLTLTSPDETAALGAAIAPILGPGDVLLLEGDVGAGKTHFARSLIQARLAAAGRQEDVPSPTYTLVQTYDDGNCEIWHADLYRVTDPAECLELGLDEAFDAAICLVEWPAVLGPARPENALVIGLKMTRDPQARSLRISGPSGRWSERLDHALRHLTTG